ncbi:methyltransferase, FxLD system [Actinomadura rudentiformis]|uniref:Protein-L-isoaspartate O-methyltransferase n=1 Tax=Actinomadura rudentiformis TaxID=359158 RepID=A0A6H9YSH6_9ACTN|nr:methyltransferase, FxLD system [Actinomadura rudentiformis]KAB2344839.1 methyltransferase, FxLD system [Actinomadura rudentiformis]
MTTVRNSEDFSPALRAAMVGELRELGAITSAPVAEAVSKVPRHLFVPGQPLEAAYAIDQALVIKRDEAGTALSSLSSAHIQSVMLEQADVQPGMQVLEIGSGGYNAALLAELVGEEGAVVSLDIDPEITERARACLDTAGYEQVKVAVGDAEHGLPDEDAFDRIIVTAGAWDIPPAWRTQLTPRGRLIVPLRLKGITRTIAFERDDQTDDGGDAGVLTSVSYLLSGFVAMQGDGEHHEHVIVVGDDESWGLRVDDGAPDFDVQALREALDHPPLERWSGAVFDMPDELELFLVTSGPQMVMLHARQSLVDQGVFDASAGRGVPVLVRGDSFAYRIKRENAELGGFESGVIAHGPHAEQVADEYADLLRRWAHQHRRRGAATIRYIPAGAAHSTPPHHPIPKRHGTVSVTWR